MIPDELIVDDLGGEKGEDDVQQENEIHKKISRQPKRALNHLYEGDLKRPKSSYVKNTEEDNVVEDKLATVFWVDHAPYFFFSLKIIFIEVVKFVWKV